MALFSMDCFSLHSGVHRALAASDILAFFMRLIYGFYASASSGEEGEFSEGLLKYHIGHDF